VAWKGARGHFCPLLGIAFEDADNHLGNVAFRAGGKVVWDAKATKITNNEAANRFLSREPRKGWSL
jgi:hypothetical protein